eukprot:Seg10320.1 transcript_id=Seg10320.1/GoldUCD/mRNA.D3Y31 product="hypothetical protein" pseudo=true protein_id=Seg10320.1/GoldUCD/D3Y31
MADQPVNEINAPNEDEENPLNYTYNEVQPRNKFYVSGNKTFFRPLLRKSDDDDSEKDPIFIECVLKIQGLLVDENDSSGGAWVVSCRGVSAKLEIETR